MKLFIFFGLPGTGKTFAAQIAKKYFGYHIYDGDTDLTKEMQKTIQAKSIVTDDMRDVYFTRLIQSTKKVMQQYDNIIVHQTFIKEKYRKQFLREIPEAQYVLIETDTIIREKRLRERRYFRLDEAYARNMVNLFDKPLVQHEVIKNNADGEESIKMQLQKILV